jgi:hypothetical protein
MAKAAISPTRFQANTYPLPFRRKIRVLHDGIDTESIRPSQEARLELPSGRFLTRSDEVRPLIPKNDWARIHFLLNLNRNHFLAFLQISPVHVYLTYPFVAGWSLLEAMSVGAAIIGSHAEPVREFIQHRKTGLLTPFFNVDKLVTSIDALFDDERLRLKHGSETRKKVQSRFDLQTVCQPKWVKWAEGLASVAAPSRT